MTATTIEHVHNRRMARRNVWLLSLGQAFYGTHAVAFMTIGTLAGHMLADDKSLATLPITAFMIGTALTTVPASLLMRALGRRFGFLLGAASGILSGLLGVYAMYAGSFVVLLASAFFTGSYQACALYYRFAAADRASEAFKARAISWVLLGGVAAAFISPQLIIYTKDVFLPFQFAGTFAGLAVLGVVAALIVSFVDIPRLPEKLKTSGRPLARIAAQPRFIVAVVCGTIGYASMNMVMTASPLAMVACNHTAIDAAYAVQWHAVAMFAPSFFTGNLIDRFGVIQVIFAGMVLLVGSATVALTGVALWQFWTVLILLGLGWNFSFVGATTMLTDCHTEGETGKVQALNDFMIFGAVAVGSFSSGILLNQFGWNVVNVMLFPFVAVCVVLLGWLVLVERKRAAA